MIQGKLDLDIGEQLTQKLTKQETIIDKMEVKIEQVEEEILKVQKAPPVVIMQPVEEVKPKEPIPEPIPEDPKEESVDSIFDGVIDLTIEKVAKGEEIAELRSKKGSATMRKITRDICEGILD